jgi:hypothetical protein
MCPIHRNILPLPTPASSCSYSSFSLTSSSSSSLYSPSSSSSSSYPSLSSFRYIHTNNLKHSSDTHSHAAHDSHSHGSGFHGTDFLPKVDINRRVLMVLKEIEKIDKKKLNEFNMDKNDVLVEEKKIIHILKLRIYSNVIY